MTPFQTPTCAAPLHFAVQTPSRIAIVTNPYYSYLPYLQPSLAKLDQKASKASSPTNLGQIDARKQSMSDDEVPVTTHPLCALHSITGFVYVLSSQGLKAASLPPLPLVQRPLGIRTPFMCT